MEKEPLPPSDDEMQPVEEAPETPSAKVVSPPVEPKGKNFFQKFLPWFAAVLVSLLVGFALGAFLLYIPARDALRQSQADLASTKSSLELAETKAEGMQSSLDSATSQLESAQSELKSSNLSLVISKLQENIGRARLALVSKDILTARQELSDADANLAELTLSLDDIETTSAMADRLKTIRTNLTSDPSKALEEMRILGENLARLENR